jgi:hypothetical protein
VHVQSLGTLRRKPPAATHRTLRGRGPRSGRARHARQRLWRALALSLSRGTRRILCLSRSCTCSPGDPAGHAPRCRRRVPRPVSLRKPFEIYALKTVVAAYPTSVIDLGLATQSIAEEAFFRQAQQVLAPCRAVNLLLPCGAPEESLRILMERGRAVLHEHGMTESMAQGEIAGWSALNRHFLTQHSSPFGHLQRGSAECPTLEA